MSIAAVFLVALLFAAVLTSRAQAYSYSSEEITFVNLLNNYRVQNGLKPLLISDAISQASYRHNHDMAKYKFFGHYTVQSDWFPKDAAPWDRMALNGYGYYTTKGENIAGGQQTGAAVFAAWKASAGHNANMLSSAYTVIGVSLYQLAGSPCTFYWTTDFGGYTDSTAHAVNATSSPTVNCYQQTSTSLLYSGTWGTYSTPSASGGSYKRSSTSGAYVVIPFNGTRLDWIATKGTTMGKADVYVDGVLKTSPTAPLDLYRSTVAYQQVVFSTGNLAPGYHTVKIVRNKNSALGKYVNIDAVTVYGTVTANTLLQQTDTHLVWSPSLLAWTSGSSTYLSGGSYRYINKAGSVTINFTGVSLDVLAKKASSYGIAKVTLDGTRVFYVNLYRSITAYKQTVWSSGILAPGNHTVTIAWTGTKSGSSGTTIDLDAFYVRGVLR